MAPGQQLALEFNEEQRERLMRVLKHWKGKVVEERTLEGDRRYILAEKF